jgi:hypothetical protein
MNEVGCPKPQIGIQKSVKVNGKTSFERIDEDEVRGAIFQYSTRIVPGPDRSNFKAIGLLWAWDMNRVIALVRTSVQLGYNSMELKTKTGVVIPKPEKKHLSNDQEIPGNHTGKLFWKGC